MVLSLVVSESYLEDLKKILDATKNDDELFEAIANAPFHDKLRTTMLGLGFISFTMVNKRNRTVDRTSYSKTDTAQGAIDITVKPYKELVVPLDYKGNIVAEAIRSGRYQQTIDWNYLLEPVLTPE